MQTQLEHQSRSIEAARSFTRSVGRHTWYPYITIHLQHACCNTRCGYVHHRHRCRGRHRHHPLHPIIVIIAIIIIVIVVIGGGIIVIIGRSPLRFNDACGLSPRLSIEFSIIPYSTGGT